MFCCNESSPKRPKSPILSNTSLKRAHNVVTYSLQQSIHSESLDFLNTICNPTFKDNLKYSCVNTLKSFALIFVKFENITIKHMFDRLIFLTEMCFEQHVSTIQFSTSMKCATRISISFELYITD